MFVWFHFSSMMAHREISRSSCSRIGSRSALLDQGFRGILIPASGSALAQSSDFVVHCEAQAFLEAVAGVHNIPPNVSAHLQHRGAHGKAERGPCLEGR